jgi:signal transduction histidine kinase
MAGSQRISWPDIGLTAVLLLVGLNGTGPAAANQGQTVPVAGYLLVVAACLPIVMWRWRPLWALAGSGTATAAYLAPGYAYGPIMFPLVVALYGYAARARLRRVMVATGVLAATAVAALAAEMVAGDRGWPEFLTGIAWVVAWLIIPAAVGVVVKARRDATAEVRAEQARRGVSEERLRLAQEVHDVVGHSLAVVALQAGVVLRVLDRDPERAREAVEAIRSTSTEALDSLRAELDTLRRAGAQPQVPRRPRTGLADLPALVERICASGLPVSVDGPPDGVVDLPARVDHAAYRIVQEALTNVLRHGGPQAVARVRLERTADGFAVDVTSTGAAGGPAPAGAGHGIAGMRERAHALGGTVEAQPRPAGGFTVRARLPLPAGDGQRTGGT